MTRRAVGTLVAVLLLGSLVLGALAMGIGKTPTLGGHGTCRLVASRSERVDGDLRLDSEQMTNAAIVVGVAKALGLPLRASVIGLATALQESGLRSLNQQQSDRNSAGIFQQRPSMGWGSVTQVMDPVHAAEKFYTHLIQVPGWAGLPLTKAAQSVQRSAYPDAYAKWGSFASALASALAGNGAAKVECEIADERVPVVAQSSQKWPAEAMGSDGLTSRTRYVRDLIHNGFGETNIGGWCPGGCTSGHIEGSDHYTGHAIDVMILPWRNLKRVADGNRLAAWLVANARQLAIKYVIWRGSIWTDEKGWHAYESPSGSEGPTVTHMDHVHVSVS